MSLDALIDSTMEVLKPYEHDMPSFDRKYFTRPPIKFIALTISAISKHTGYGAGVFSDAQMQGNLPERDDKLDFFELLKNYTQILINQAIDVEPKSIAAGKEVEKTLIFLQSIVQAATKPAIPFEAAKSKLTGQPPESQAKPKPEAKPEPKPEAKPEAKPEPKPEPKPEHKPEPKPAETKPQPKPEAKEEPKPAPKPAEPKPQPKPAEPKPEPKPEAKPEHKPEAKPEQKPEHKPETKPAETKPKPESKEEIKPAAKPAEPKPAPKPAEPEPKPQKKEVKIQEIQPAVPSIKVEEVADETNPSGIRPMTARKAPPKIKEEQGIISETAAPALIPEAEADNEVDDIYVEEDARGNAAPVSGAESGKLVKDILDACKQIGPAADSMTNANEPDRFKQGIELAKKLLQHLAQSAQPLDTLIQFSQEDLGNMENEYKRWTAECEKQQKNLEAEKANTEQQLNELNGKIEELDKDIVRQESKLRSIKAAAFLKEGDMMKQFTAMCGN